MIIQERDGDRTCERQGTRRLRQAVAAVFVVCLAPVVTAAPTALAATPICPPGYQAPTTNWVLSQVPLVSSLILLPSNCLPITPPDVWLPAPPPVSVGDQFTIEAGSASLASWSIPNGNARLHVIAGCTSGARTCTMRADNPMYGAVNGQFIIGVTYQEPGQQPVREVTDIATREVDLWSAAVILRNANLEWRQTHRLRAVRALDPAGAPTCLQDTPIFTDDTNGTPGAKWKQYIADQTCWVFGNFLDVSYQSAIAALASAQLPLGGWWIEAAYLDDLTGPADPGFAPRHLDVAGHLADNLDATLGAQPPHAEFTAAAEEAGSPKWNFDASASTASDPATIARYDWDFGDVDHTTATGMTASHIYAGSGTYTVSLTVTDSQNMQTTVTHDIEVTSSLVVNSTGDAPNSSETSVACNTGGLVDDKPECTLRAAIMAANAAAKAQTISFDIPGLGVPTIAVTSSLPTIKAPVRVDGTTQAGGWVGLTAPDITATTGLVADAADVTITGMVTSGFRTAMATLAANARFIHNRVGVDSTGATVTTAPGRGISVLQGGSAIISDNVITAVSFGVFISTTTTATITANRIGTNGGNGAALPTVPDTGVWVAGGIATVDTNVVASKTIGVMIKSPAAGSKVTANHVGVNAAGNGFTSSEVAIVISGSPGVLVEGNHAVSTREPYGDIVVTGNDQTDTELHQPRDALTGPVTGGATTVRGNLLGMLADGSPIDVASVGVLVFGRANDVTIIDNDIAGHTGAALVWADNSSDITVKQNRLGVKPGAASASGGVRNGVKFGGVTGGTIDGNVIVGSIDAGIEITTDTAPGSFKDSSTITIARNVVGLAADGSTVIANRVGVHAVGATIVIGPGNVISGNTEAGIVAEPNGAGMQIVGNAIGLDGTQRLARPNATGVAIDGFEVEVVSNRIAGNTGTGLWVKSSTYATIFDNDIGFGVGGQPLGNGVGVSIDAGSGRMLQNDVRNSVGAGIAVASTARLTIGSNSTWDNVGKGIDGEGVPAAPKLDVVQARVRGLDRLWFVLTDNPSAVGIIKIYGNESCTAPNDDEGHHPIETIVNGSHDRSVVLSPRDRNGLQYAFYTVTFTVQDGGTDDKPLGRTSEFSTCAAPHAYPDTSGTGIPNIIQTALGGDPANQRKVIFPSDNGGTVTLAAPTGRLVNVGPSSAPEAPAGVDLPSGQFAFELTGITPGGPAAVAVSTSIAATWYYRYGPPATGLAASWYTWNYDPATGLGGQQISPTEWVLHFFDGASGDDDGSANGTIVDPGGPGNGPQIAPVANPVTQLPTAPVPQLPTAPVFGELPATGSNESTGTLALALLCVGIGLLLFAHRRTRPSREVSRRPRRAS